MGIGATITMDLWAVFMQRVFKMKAPNYCLVGRWFQTMPEGTFGHTNIGSAPQKRAECTIGWITHYTIGVIFAIAFVTSVGNHWLQHPALIPAMVFGIVTVGAPFLIMQPAFGLGVAGSKTSNPFQTRLRSLMNHIIFGLGLYIFGLLSNWLR
jgi:hypothetical protein